MILDTYKGIDLIDGGKNDMGERVFTVRNNHTGRSYYFAKENAYMNAQDKYNDLINEQLAKESS